jgi:Uma2 family endonuclease
MAVEYARHRITVHEYHRMSEAGVFGPEARLELIDGELVEHLTPMNPPHARVVRILNAILVRALGERALICCQLPITLGEASEPEPDFTLVRGPESRYDGRHPEAGDILCVIEVAESSLQFDLRRKRPLYAEHGIPEYLAVDLDLSRVHVFRDPLGSAYENATIAFPGDEVSLLAFPDVRIRVADVLS